ncbi:CDK-activating kinase assembly factor MAT1-like isoform X1 [Halichondria panicea]|uniref:CDK-activating kinase assembly factor MAT1-like isoform X1 n=1 Tax=Halichondria panicea TaxID=6063 RepID=UPI00312B5FC1
MDQLKCPRCKTSSYQKPNLKLLVNVCGHKLCGDCVEVVFIRASGPCPECGVVLRKNQFRLQQFDDSYIEKEVDIRKKILKDYNKTERDFPSLREYNDYLEEVETIIYNLANGVDVDQTRAKMDAYKKDNQTLIMKNRDRQLRVEKVLMNQIHQEVAERDYKNKEALEIEKRITIQKKREKDSIIDELIYSDRPASEVLASHAAVSGNTAGEESSETVATKKDALLPSHHALVGMTVFDPLPMSQGKVYSYQPLLLSTWGPGVPELEEMESFGYLSNMRCLEEHHIGSGFVPAYACQRALQDAFSCLLLKPQDI